MTNVHSRSAEEATHAAPGRTGPTVQRFNSALEHYLAAVGSPSGVARESVADHLVIERLADHRVFDVMSAPAISVGPTASFKQIVRILAEHRISAVPVVSESGEVLGIVSETDLLAHVVEAQGHQVPFGTKSQQRAKALGETAADVMTTPAVVVRDETPFLDAAQLAARKRVRRMPVVNRSGLLVGLITRSDFLGVFLAADDQLLRHIDKRVLKFRFPAEARSVQVAVTDGVVTLTGKVPLRTTALAILAAVRAVAGVVAVHDNLVTQVDDSRLPPSRKRP